MRCLCAWRLGSVRGAGEQCGVGCLATNALSREQGSNALFGCLATMLDRGVGKQCAIWVPGDYAMTVERGSNAVFESSVSASPHRLLCLCAW